MAIRDDYLENVEKYKDKINLNECTTTAFFTLLMQRIGILYHYYLGIFWDKGWKLRFVIILAQIRAMCDKMVDLIEDDKVEHPVNTVVKVLGESNIDIDDVIIKHGSTDTKEIELVTPDEAEQIRRKAKESASSTKKKPTNSKSLQD